MTNLDLVLRGGRVIDPARGIEECTTSAFEAAV